MKDSVPAFQRSTPSLAFPVLLALLAAISTRPAWSGTVAYVYDARGRLAAVTAEDGVTYAYGYDDAGNLSYVRSTGILISKVTPESGKVGDDVVLEGIGFDANGTEVRFNGTLAEITIGTATQIETKVPPGASSGSITVTNQIGTAKSFVDFEVEGGPPSISNFTPKSGAAGTGVLLQGTGIDPDVSHDTVTLNGVLSTISTAGTTSLTFAVPSGVGSGKITLETFQPPAFTMTQDFLVAPPGYVASVIERGVRANAYGTSTSVAVSQAGKISLLLFEASAGQNLGLAFGADAALCTTSLLVRPDNTVFPSPGTTLCGAGFLDPVILDQTGTWTLAVDPTASTTGTRTVTLYEVPDDPSLALGFVSGPTGSVGTLPTTVPGQNAKFTFQAQAGDMLSFTAAVTDVNPRQCLTWRIRRPNGTELAADSCVSNNFFHDRTTLDTTGTWTIVGDEANAAPVHTYQLRVHKVPADVTIAALAENANYSAITTTPGQNALFTILRLSNSSVRFTHLFRETNCSTHAQPSCKTFRIYRPNGTLFSQSTCIATNPFTSGYGNWNAVGIWTIEVDGDEADVHCHTLSYDVQ